MNWTLFLDTLFSTQAPLLPGQELLRWGRALSWGLVLAGFALRLTGFWPRPARLGLAAVLMGVCVLPSPWSPSYWLGLAFQSPSLMTTVLVAWMGLRVLRPDHLPRPDTAAVSALGWASVTAVLLGWLLLLDTFAVWPFSLYAFGFSPAALGAVALLAVLPWVFIGPRHGWGWVAALLGGVLLLHVVLRLPTGNVWDALMDPWLWVVLHINLVWGKYTARIAGVTPSTK